MKSLDDYLLDFKPKAEEFLKDNIQIKFHSFFQEFFKKENLEKAEWPDFQEMGNYIHSFNSMALAKKKALGNPNHPIQHYRDVLLFLIYGPDEISIRIKKFYQDKSLELRNFGNSVKSELVAHAFPESYGMFNFRDEEAIELLGIQKKSYAAASFYERYCNYYNLIQPIKEKYLTVVGHKSTLPINLEIDQFFSYLYEQYGKSHQISYWQIAPGDQAFLWQDCFDRNIIRIGWDELGDVSDLNSKEEIEKKYFLTHPKGNKHSFGMFWRFYNDLKEGDYIIANQGKSKVVGVGIVKDSTYYFDESLSKYRHYKFVDWNNSIPAFNIKQNNKFGKTIQKLTKDDYDEIISHRNNSIVVEENGVDRNSSNIHYYWLNANPKIWDLNSIKIGERQTYTAINEKGHKRNRYKYFEMAKPGDILIGYISTPIKEITSICRITKELHQFSNEGLRIEFEKVEQLSNPVSFGELQKIPGLKNCEPIINNQGSLFAVTPDEFEIIREIIDDKNLIAPTLIKSYSKAEALKDLFIAEQDYNEILDVIFYKKNIILQGPPGVGKTFIAKRIAFSILGKIDESKIEMIQFHQSYSYEDFIQGFRPNEDGKFDIVNGIFYDFCRKALRDSSNKYFFIIDEINRGNLSKIFGELMMLIEHDKRGSNFSIPLTYSRSNDERFFIPENLHIIGTMNTADRSLALVDYALRRRFSFIALKPLFDDKFKKYLHDQNVDDAIIIKIIDRVSEINKTISNDKKNLGGGFQIGHSFFCTYPLFNKIDSVEWYKKVIKTEIAPLLREYWFDDEDFAQKKIDYLLQ